MVDLLEDTGHFERSPWLKMDGMRLKIMKKAEKSPSLGHMGVSETWRAWVFPQKFFFLSFLFGNMMRHHGIFWVPYFHG